MPRKPATAPEPAATRAPRARAKSASLKPAAKAVSKAVTKPATKPAARPAAKATRAATAKGGLKTAVKSAARALANPPARKAVAKPAAKAVERAPVQDARPVLVRDSFTMPEREYAVLLEVKQACLRAGIDVKKSELLRIGVALLGQLDVATLQGVLAALPQLKTGRPPAQE